VVFGSVFRFDLHFLDLETNSSTIFAQLPFLYHLHLFSVPSNRIFCLVATYSLRKTLVLIVSLSRCIELAEMNGSKNPLMQLLALQ